MILWVSEWSRDGGFTKKISWFFFMITNFAYKAFQLMVRRILGTDIFKLKKNRRNTLETTSRPFVPNKYTHISQCMSCCIRTEELQWRHQNQDAIVGVKIIFCTRTFIRTINKIRKKLAVDRPSWHSGQFHSVSLIHCPDEIRHNSAGTF
jgi:hypothetical protein